MNNILSPEPHRRPFSRLFASLMLCWATLHLPLLLGLRVLPSDAMYEFYPMVYFNVHAIHSGLAPWWNPQIFAGYPQIADPQAMLFAPLLMAWMLLRSDPGMTWFVWGALLHVLLGGAGMLALLRQLKATDFGALLGSLVFMAGGVAASRIQYVPILLTYSFLPAALFTMRHFIGRPGPLAGVCMGLTAGCMLAQPVQLTYLAGIALLTYGLIAIVRAWPSWSRRDRWNAITGGAAACAVAAAMAGPQLLFSYAFVAVSNRPALPLEAATNMSVDARSLLTFVAPNAMQSLRGTYDGPVDPIETFFYIGAIPSLLIIAGTRGAWRIPCQRRHLMFCLLMAALAILYMLGGHTPLYEILYRWLPGIKQFRRPSDAAYLLNLGLAVTVGLAASHINLRNSAFIRRTLAIATIWLGVSSVHMYGLGERWQAATIIAPLSCFAAALWFKAKRRPVSTTCACLLAVVVIDYRCFNLNGEFNQRGDRALHFRRDPAVQFVTERMRLDSAAESTRVEALDVGAGWKNFVVLKGLQAVQGYGPLRWMLFDRYFGSYGDGDGPRPTSSYNPDPSSHFNRLLGVRYVVQPAGRGASHWSMSDHSEAIVYADERTEVFELGRPLPHVITPAEGLASSGPFVTPDELAGIDPLSRVLLTPRHLGETATLRKAIESCGPGITATLASRTHVRTSVTVESPTGGWLVIASPDFPGWTASIDGTEVPQWRANGMFRSVCVPGGRHVVKFAFRPWRMVKEVAIRPDAWR